MTLPVNHHQPLNGNNAVTNPSAGKQGDFSANWCQARSVVLQYTKGDVPMIIIFNRKELVVTMDMAKQGVIRDILAAHGIEYYVRTMNLSGSSAMSARGSSGSFGMNLVQSVEYKIYVKKKDYEKASYLIRGI